MMNLKVVELTFSIKDGKEINIPNTCFISITLKKIVLLQKFCHL